MSWNNYKWAWNLRGVTPSEQLVCLRLADEANASGYIERLSHNGIQRKITALSRKRIRTIMSTLHAKKLIKSRTIRTGARGQQVSNAYQLDLRRMHPPDPVGARLWTELTSTLVKKAPDTKAAIPIHAADSSAFYEPEGKHLTVFLDSRGAYRFFQVYLLGETPLYLSPQFDPAISRLELLHIS